MDETRDRNPGRERGIASFQEPYLAVFSEEERSFLLKLGPMLGPSDPRLAGGPDRGWAAVGADLRYLEAHLGDLSVHLPETLGADPEVCEAFAAAAGERAIEIGEIAEKLEPLKGIGKVAFSPDDWEHGPGGWEGDGGFYETFLVWFSEEEAETLRRLASMLFAYNLENRAVSAEREPYHQWRAVGVALRHLERFLRSLLEVEDGELDELRAGYGREHILAALGRLAALFEGEAKGARVAA